MADQNTTRYHWLDAWRGVACLMLVIYHAMFYVDEPIGPFAGDGFNLLVWIAKRMWIGVPIFFVISGYCIAGSIQSLQSRPGGLLKFAQKRFLRIYPPLWAACAFAAILWLLASLSPFLTTHCLQIKGAGNLSAWQWLGNLTATESWLHHIVHSGTGPNYLVGIIWTLCYEEQFYLVAAFALLMFKGRAILGIAMVTALCALLFLLGAAATSNLTGLFLDGHWLLFSFGWAAHFALQQSKLSIKMGIIAALILTVISAILHMRGSHTEEVLHFDLSLASAAAFAILLVIAHRWDAVLTAAPITRPFSAIGRMSYSIYLIHYAPVTLIAAVFAGLGYHSHGFTLAVVAPLSLIASILIALPFYRWIELRFTSVRRRSQREQNCEQQILGSQKMPC